MLINTLKQFKALKSVNLATFANICADLNLTQFLASALRKMNKQHMLVSHYTVRNIMDQMYLFEPGNARENQAIHARIEAQFSDPTTLKHLAAWDLKPFIPTRYCCMLLRN